MTCWHFAGKETTMSLDIQCQDHLDKVRAFAVSVSANKQLQETLDYLATYAQPNVKTTCRLYRDFAPHSFTFLMMREEIDGSLTRWFNGGMIYSGPGSPSDGSAPSFCVSLNPDESSGRTHRWSIHT